VLETNLHMIIAGNLHPGGQLSFRSVHGSDPGAKLGWVRVEGSRGPAPQGLESPKSRAKPSQMLSLFWAIGCKTGSTEVRVFSQILINHIQEEETQCLRERRRQQVHSASRSVVKVVATLICGKSPTSTSLSAPNWPPGATLQALARCGKIVALLEIPRFSWISSLT
jgi:hypothetical protein